MAKQNYSINEKKKIITATIEKLDTVEKEIVQMYINAGYILHKGKSNPWNKETIYKWLKKYVDEATANSFYNMVISENEKNNKLKVFYNKDKYVGWVNGRKWFFDTYTEEKRAKLEKATTTASEE